jgi:hypothetical protein
MCDFTEPTIFVIVSFVRYLKKMLQVTMLCELERKLKMFKKSSANGISSVVTCLEYCRQQLNFLEHCGQQLNFFGIL